MSEFDESIIDIVDKLSRRLTHEQIHEFAKDFLEYVESVLDLDYETESEYSDSDDSIGDEEELQHLINEGEFYSLK